MTPACAIPQPSRSSHATSLARSLARLGFHADGTGFSRDQFRFRIAGSWAVLEKSLGAESASPLGDIGQPGLWRTVLQAGRGSRVFELPSSLLAFADEAAAPDDEDENPFAACLAWALATADGQLPPDWQPEPRHEIDALFPKHLLTVLAGGAIRQGEWLHSPGRLALRFQLLPTTPATLPATRREWLAKVLQDAQCHWSLVRLGPADAAPGSGLRAEIDFSGAPAPALEPLLSAGLASLRFVVAQLVETVELLADAAVASVALDSAAFLKPQPKDHQP